MNFTEQDALRITEKVESMMGKEIMFMSTIIGTELDADIDTIYRSSLSIISSLYTQGYIALKDKGKDNE